MPLSIMTRGAPVLGRMILSIMALSIIAVL
jgi:hypothetical protein